MNAPAPHAGAAHTGAFDPAAWRARFLDDGFAVMPGAIAGERLRALRERTDRLTDAAAIPETARALIDLEPELLDGRPAVQRVRKPYEADPFFMDLARAPELLALVRPLLGEDVRLHHGKINVKAPRVGSPLEWHQDWAFIPHTNSSLAIVSILIDDCGPQSGPVQFLPGSHTGPLHPHHHDGVFVGAISPSTLDMHDARSVIGAAGTVAVHHPMTVHGSGFNLGTGPRRVLFFEYAAADAWPLFYGVEWHEFNRRMVCGQATDAVRLEPVAVRMPYPNPSEGQGRIYDLQRHFEQRHFVSPAAAAE
jgi:ectoine hydroxylase-related dioxygenase (phytanoyl-CoA dioxygenase family)